MSLAGKVALITGASKGIGRATALRLARDGASVVVNYLSDAAGAREVVEQIGSDKALAIQADAGNVAAITDMIEQIIAKFGKIDIVLAGAGMLAMSPLESTSEELFDKMFALNVKGPYFLCQVCIALFRPPLRFCPVIAHAMISSRKPRPTCPRARTLCSYQPPRIQLPRSRRLIFHMSPQRVRLIR